MRIKYLLYFLIIILLSDRSFGRGLSCKSLLSLRASTKVLNVNTGLTPETNPVNTLFIGYSRGQFNATHLELLRSVPSEIQIVLILLQPHEPDSNFDLIKQAHPNIRIIIDESWHAKMWTRDWVPQKVVRSDGSIEYVSMAYDNTKFAAKFLMEKLGLPYHISNLTGEMGNIETDGKGRLFTTEQIFDDNIEGFFSAPDSPDLDIKKQQVIDQLKRDFSAEDVVILPAHPADGNINHIDLLIKYVGNINAEDTFVVADSRVASVKQVLDKVAKEISSLGYRVIRILEHDQNIGRGAAGFINSLVMNNTVYMPIYSPAENDNSATKMKLLSLEKNARGIYESLGFEVVEIDSAEPIKGGGAIHCLTCTTDLRLD